MTQDANELLMSGGVKAAKFDTLGATVIGTIADTPKAVQMTKFQSDDLDFWPSGDPKMQIIVTIQTDDRDPADPQDDGRRRLYIIPRMMQQVREAVVRAGGKGLAIGGRIAVKWVSGTGKGEGNAKQYAADYAAPALDPGSLLNGGVSAAAAPVAAAPITPPITTSMLTAAAPVAPVAQVAAPAGVDPTVWASLPDAQRQAILAAMSNPTATAAPF